MPVGAAIHKLNTEYVYDDGGQFIINSNGRWCGDFNESSDLNSWLPYTSPSTVSISLQNGGMRIETNATGYLSAYFFPLTATPLTLGDTYVMSFDVIDKNYSASWVAYLNDNSTSNKAIKSQTIGASTSGFASYSVQFVAITGVSETTAAKFYFMTGTTAAGNWIIVDNVSLKKVIPARKATRKSNPFDGVMTHEYYSTSGLHYAIPFDDIAGETKARYCGYGLNASNTITGSFAFNNEYVRCNGNSTIAYPDIAVSAVPKFGFSTSWTVAFWIRANTGSAINQYAFAMNNNSGGGEWLQMRALSNGNWRWRLIASGGTPDTYIANNVTNNDWQHHAITYNPAGSAVTYVNGVSVSSFVAAPYILAAPPTNCETSFGSKPVGAAGEYVFCDIMNFVNYDRQLTQEEIKACANARRPDGVSIIL